jgi:hypothetical protein
MFIADNEWCFIHIPKTSGTNLMHVFPDERCIKYGENEHWNEFWSDTNLQILLPFLGPIKGCNIVKHAPLYFWEEIGVVTDQKVFTIVRNPYTRFLSWYHEMNRIVEFFNLPFVNVSFEQFIESKYINVLLNQLPHKVFTNKTNQVDYLVDKTGRIRVDKVYKMETDLEQIENDFNITDINTFKINFLNYDRDYAKVYTPKMIDWVQQNFQKDFEYFGYNNKPFW